MPAKVFISCGQANDEETQVARAVANWLQDAGFTPYVAIEAQSMQDVNSGIIDELKSADYYLLIDFRREKVAGTPKDPVFRGSLFTHQELAIAYVLGFPHAIFLRQQGTELNGLGKYMLTNARQFSCSTEVVGLVKQLVTERKWSPGYSRHLVIVNFDRFKTPAERGESKRFYKEYEWFALIANHRLDLPARRAVARLVAASDGSGKTVELQSAARAPLMWDAFLLGRTGIKVEREVDLLPGESMAFKAFSIFSGKRTTFESWDEDAVHIGHGWIQGCGAYRVRYQVLAEGFPPCEFAAEINITGRAETATGRACG